MSHLLISVHAEITKVAPGIAFCGTIGCDDDITKE